MNHRFKILPFVLVLGATCLGAYDCPGQKIIIDKNKPERKEWFQDMGFGMFIHWSVDVQLGSDISHNLAVSSRQYQEQYFNELHKTFNPKEFDPEEWAILARLAGMKYMVFTAKHHNGFCMWHTKTTGYNIMNTPFGRDALAEVIAAFRKQGIAIGLYFSPDDFHVLYQQDLPISRVTAESESTRNTALWDLNKRQLQELLTEYGKIDLLFIDEMADWVNPLVANYAWELDPDLFITRGGLPTPEQRLPDQPLPGPWEACLTMGSHWQYVGEERHKDAGTLINLLIETRAKGGNLLLNVGPTPQGRIAPEQEARLREIGLWYRANREALENVRAWNVARENDIWFTRSKDGSLIYAFVNAPNWRWTEGRSFFIRSVAGGARTSVSVLGQDDKVMEYRLDLSPKTLHAVHDEGLFVHAIRAQRLNFTWTNPLVIRISGAEYRSTK
jgi:alpha-L-fucosidase